MKPIPVPAYAEVTVAVNATGTFRVAVLGAVTLAVRSGHAIFTTHDTAGAERAEVPDAFDASIV